MHAAKVQADKHCTLIINTAAVMTATQRIHLYSTSPVRIESCV